jgi:putative Mg2+ transporter-C (MgtC) family protein
MLVSAHFAFFQHYVSSDLVKVDPSRIASGVVMGMGFLGAGAILRRGFDVHGLTTAASLWMVSAVGLAAGCGMFPEAVAATALALFVLVGLTVIEARFKQRVRRWFDVVFEGGPSRTELVAFFRSCGIDVNHVDFVRDLKTQRERFSLELSLPSDAGAESCLSRLEALPGLRRVQVRDIKPST